jgi:hypothetical protein
VRNDSPHGPGSTEAPWRLRGPISVTGVWRDEPRGGQAGHVSELRVLRPSELTQDFRTATSPLTLWATTATGHLRYAYAPSRQIVTSVERSLQHTSVS